MRAHAPKKIKLPRFYPRQILCTNLRLHTKICSYVNTGIALNKVKNLANNIRSKPNNKSNRNCNDNSNNKSKHYCAEVGTCMILNIAVLCTDSVDEPYKPTYYGNSVKKVKPNVTPRANRL